MSVISKNRDNTSGASQSPVIGKVSIGRPASEPVLAEHSEGLKTRFKVEFDDGTGIQRGKTIRKNHVQKMLDNGKREVQVMYGKSPTTLNHFRVLRKSNISDGFVEDPEVYDKYDLEPGDTLTEIPIMFTSENIDKVLQTQMVNYDRDHNCVFCSSEDGETATRRRTDGEGEGEGDYLPNGAKKEVECVPFYWDERVETGNKNICQFRETGGDGRDCKFTGSLYFQILNEAGDFDLGRYFKIETTSSRTAEYYMDALLDIKNESQFERISFVPLKLEIIKEQGVRPGNQYEDRKRASFFRTTISVDSRYVKKYKDVVKDMVQTMKEYREMNSDLGISTRDPTEIPTENAPAEETGRWESEFDPDQYQQSLEEEGLTEEAEEAEKEGPELPQFGEEDESDGGDKEAGEGMSGGAYDMKRQALINEARRLPPDKFDRFVDSLDKVSEDTIGKFRDRVDNLLGGLTEQEKEEHFEENKGKSLEDDEEDELPFG